MVSIIRTTRLSGLVVMMLCCYPAMAGNVSVDRDKDIVWKAGVGGVEIEWAPDGRFNRVYSQKCHPVGIPDNRGISKATTIAEEKAKAEIVRFIEQKVFSGRVVTEVDSDLEQATSSISDKGESFSKETKRQMVETLTTITGSSASGVLRGVVLLDTGYDAPRREACVRVGVSRKTMAAAGDVSDALKGGGKAPVPGGAAGKPGGPVNQSESRSTNMKNW